MASKKSSGKGAAKGGVKGVISLPGKPPGKPPKKSRAPKSASASVSQRVRLLLSKTIEKIDKQTGEIKSHLITQRELAKKLGVSDRTIRRWKRGDAQPRQDHALVLSREYKRERDKRIKAGAPRVAIPPLAEYRKLREFERGKWTGRFYRSPLPTYDVRRFAPGDVAAFLRQLKREGDYLVNIVYRIRRGEAARQFRRDSGRWPAGGTGYHDLSTMTDAQIWSWVMSLIENYDDEVPDEDSDETPLDNLLEFITVVDQQQNMKAA